MLYLQLLKDLLDVPETAFCNIHVLLISPLLKEWLGSVVKELKEREVFFDLLDISLLPSFWLRIAKELFPSGQYLKWAKLDSTSFHSIQYATAMSD